MDTIERTATQLVITGDDSTGYLIHNAAGLLITSFWDQNEANRFVYEEGRKALDPAPWIMPSTMARFAEEQPGFCIYNPRIVWPEHGGQMVRRDHLRPGDRAVSSHYGIRTVASVRLGGTEGQTATISWVDAPQSESYPSESKIELLPSES